MKFFNTDSLVDTRKYIKSRLKELGINQSELARRLGISKVHVSTLLSGKDFMSAYRLKTITDIVGVPQAVTGFTYSKGETLSTAEGEYLFN